MPINTDTGIQLFCKPHKTVDWETFRRYLSHSIAIDGYCSGPPRATSDGLILNINHHEGVEEFATRASCMQAYYELMTGLYDRLSKDGKPHARLFVNDRDQDVVMTTAALMYPDLIHLPKMRRFLEIVDLLDSSAGLFPLDEDIRRNELPELCYIFEPFTASRQRGEDGTLTAKQCEKQIRQMHRRLKANLRADKGKAKRLTPDKRYEALGKHPLYTVVREVGQHARYGMSEDGITAFVSVLDETPGRSRFSICRLSHTTPLPQQRFYAALNKAEGIPEDADQKWGGGSTRGGSPRKDGTTLTLEQVCAVMDAEIAQSSEMRKALLEEAAIEAEARKERRARSGEGKSKRPKRNS
jgi:hypothetical protein